MRKLIAAVLLAALVAMPATAAPVDVDQAGRSITTRVLEIVTGLLAKIGPGFDRTGAKNDDGESDRQALPLDGLGAGPDPWG